MSFAGGQVSVGNTATSIISSNTNRKVLNIKNIGNNTVFLGTDNSVTTSNGYPLEPQEEFVCNDYTGQWYGIVASGTETVDYVEEDL